MNNRKGSVSDMIFLGVFIFSFALIGVLGYVIWGNFNDKIQPNDSVSDSAKEFSQSYNTDLLHTLDNMALIAFIGASLGLVISAFMLGSHPGFFIVAIIVLAVGVLLAAQLSNVYEEFSAQENISDYADDFTILPFLFDNYPKILLVLGFLLMIAVYAKTQSVGEG